MDKIKKQAFTNSLLTAGYIVLVGSFMYYGSEIKIGQNNTVLVPITLLLLFVFSAAITGFLVFGKPTLMYLDGKKKEAVELLSYTLGFLFVITFLAILLLLFNS